MNETDGVFQNEATIEQQFEEAIVLFALDTLFSGVAQDPETGEVTDDWLLGFLQQRVSLPEETLNRLIDRSLHLYADLLDEGKSENDWRAAAEALLTSGVHSEEVDEDEGDE